MRFFFFFLIGSLSLSSLNAAAVARRNDPPVEESTKELDKEAVRKASSDADTWAASVHEPVHPVVVEPPPSAPPPMPATAAAPAPTAVPAAVAQAKTPRVGMNEMHGKLRSLSDDSKTFRMEVDGGYNVEFAYTDQTAVQSGTKPIPLASLRPGDELNVRYAGRDLIAVEIERHEKKSP